MTPRSARLHTWQLLHWPDILVVLHADEGMPGAFAATHIVSRSSMTNLVDFWNAPSGCFSQ